MTGDFAPRTGQPAATANGGFSKAPELGMM
jgi:hypothetical protein